MTQLETLRRTGIRRIGTPKSGFRYVRPDGRPASKQERARISELVLPPAWKHVAVSRSPGAKLQAVGQDAAGRWQYRYRASFQRQQEALKYRRLARFARSLPALRRRLRRDLRGPPLGREQVMACLLRILSTCFVRPGSARYAERNRSYGLATLRRSHVKVRGDRLVLDYPGKSGQPQHRELADRTVARIVRALLKTPGVEVFKFKDAQGQLVDVKRRHINAYIKEVMGERFSAKDFRTWAGTLICACALARAGFDPAESHTARKKKVVQAVKETAAHLGNTPSVCRSSYIFPTVLNGFDQGKVVQHTLEDVAELARHVRDDLHPAEAALVKLLSTP